MSNHFHNTYVAIIVGIGIVPPLVTAAKIAHDTTVVPSFTAHPRYQLYNALRSTTHSHKFLGTN